MKGKSQNRPESKDGQNMERCRKQIIITWLRKIEKSKMSTSGFFNKYKVPFSRSQYYIYRKRFEEYGESGLDDKRIEGGNRKLTAESEAFISGCVESNREISPKWLQQKLAERYGCHLSPSGITKVVQRLHPDMAKRPKGRPKVDKDEQHHTSTAAGQNDGQINRI
jgi:transposase